MTRPARSSPDRPPAGDGTRDADFSRAVLEDLYRYRRKKGWLVWILWLVTGIFGGHRFYLDRTGTGLLMLFTGGGALVWWLIDALLLSSMVAGYNAEQARREAAGLPPKALEFMPPLGGYRLPSSPEWVAKRGGRARLVGDAIVLILAGTGLGAFSASSGNFEAVIAVLALIGITLSGARWQALAHMPILQSFDRWNHRLRLFYYTNDPGGPLSLAFRPIFGIIVAPFRKRARAEGRLYLQLGAVFTIAFTLIDVIQASAIRGGLSISVGSLLEDMVKTFVSVYAFAAPIGAILTTHLLLERTDRLIWTLSIVAVGAMVAGLFGFSLF